MEVIGVRFHEEDKTRLRVICEMRGECPSVFIRRAVRTEFAKLGYLDDAEKQALGV